MKIILLIITFFLSCVVDGVGQVCLTPNLPLGTGKQFLASLAESKNVDVVNNTEKIWIAIKPWIVEKGGNNATTQAEIDKYIVEVNKVYSNANIQFYKLSTTIIDADDIITYDAFQILKTDTDINKIGQNTQYRTDQAINIYFVEGIYSIDGKTKLKYRLESPDATAPFTVDLIQQNNGNLIKSDGKSIFNNASYNGIYISGRLFGIGNQTMAHEIGHYLGLFHTFQNSGNRAERDNIEGGCDMISDTPIDLTDSFLIHNGDGFLYHVQNETDDCTNSKISLKKAKTPPPYTNGVPFFEDKSFMTSDKSGYSVFNILDLSATEPLTDPKFNNPPLKNIMGYFSYSNSFSGGLCSNINPEFTPKQNQRIRDFVNHRKTKIDTYNIFFSIPQPTNFIGRRIRNTAYLNWDSNGNTQANLILERSTSPNTAYATIADLRPTLNSFEDTNLPAGITYYYRIRVSGTETTSFIEVIPIVTSPPGITVITHGFLPSSTISEEWKEHAMQVRKRVSSQLGNGNGATILSNNTTTHKWEIMPTTDPEGNGNLDPNEEIIFLYNWTYNSYIPLLTSGTGYLEESADVLYNMLINPLVGNTNLNTNNKSGKLITDKNSHFIGHSRGGILLLQTLARLKQYPDFSCDRLTLLDPHPAGKFGDVGREDITNAPKNLPLVAGIANGCGTFLCENGQSIQLNIPDNVVRVENFYRQSSVYEPTYDNSGISPFSGVSLNMNQNSYLLDNSTLGQENNNFGGNHSAVHQWYFKTVDIESSLSSGQINWFANTIGSFMANNSRYTIGYNSGSDATFNNKHTINQINTLYQSRTGRNQIESIFGGHFDFNSSAGWSVNINSNNEPYLQIENNEIKISPNTVEVAPETYFYNSIYHYPIYIPNNSNALQFDIKRSASTYSGSVNPGVRIDFYDANGTNVGFTARSSKTTSFTNFKVAIPAVLKGKQGSFQFTFFDNGENTTYANTGLKLILDNIELTTNPPLVAPNITASTTSIAPGEVSYLTANGCGTASVLWSNNQTGSTLIITANKAGIYSAICVDNGNESDPSNEITIASTGSGAIGNLETFYDVDPGFGQGNQVNIGTGPIIEATVSLAVNNLPQGIHTVSFRLKDAKNHWSLTHTKPFLILGKASITGQKGIETVEYFIDFLKDDYSNLLSINVTPDGDNIAIDLPMNLPMGIHSISFRVKDSEGKISIFHTKTFLVIGQGNSGQNSISKVQYFFDNDPGESTRLIQNISLDANNQTIIPINISLPEGIHAVSFRVQDTQNRWSIFHTKTFLVIGQGNGTGKIAKVEYFIDNDLGFDKGTQIPYTATPMSFNIDLSNYAQGVHVVYVRVKMDNGAWSLTHAKTFMVIPNTGQNTIDKIEYFLDNTDPGEGNAINVSFIPNSEGGVTANFDLATTQLTTGVHKISVRARGQNGIWSPIRNSNFELTQPSCTAMTTIKSGNWNDPSVWSCNRVPISTDNITISTGHTVNVPTGNYQVNNITTLAGSNLSYQTGAVILIFGN